MAQLIDDFSVQDSIALELKYHNWVSRLYLVEENKSIPYALVKMIIQKQ